MTIVSPLTLRTAAGAFPRAFASRCTNAWGFSSFPTWCRTTSTAFSACHRMTGPRPELNSGDRQEPPPDHFIFDATRINPFGSMTGEKIHEVFEGRITVRTYISIPGAILIRRYYPNTMRLDDEHAELGSVRLYPAALREEDRDQGRCRGRRHRSGDRDRQARRRGCGFRARERTGTQGGRGRFFHQSSRRDV